MVFFKLYVGRMNKEGMWVEVKLTDDTVKDNYKGLLVDVMVIPLLHTLSILCNRMRMKVRREQKNDKRHSIDE